jgi:processive 1,2-diacylglycerol beta-glucosyltransferase
MNNILRKFIFLGLLVTVVSSFKLSPQKDGSTLDTSSVKKKKITIFYSKGGGGHISATNALTSYLEKDYEVSRVNIIDEILYSFDFVRYLSFNFYQSEDIYNICLSRNWLRAVNMLARFGSRAIAFQRKSINARMIAYFDKHPTDFFISTMPLFNGCIMDVAQHYNIPFLLTTTDLDVQNYTLGLEDCPIYSNFKMTLAFEDDLLFQALKKVRLEKDQLVISGFPVRQDFLEHKDKDAIRKEWNIPADKKVIMLLMGAAGSKSCLKYARKILDLKKKVHVLVCVGRNEELGEQIKKLKARDGVTFSVVGFTKRVSDLMAVSDLFVTKAGPNSMCEAIQMQVPLIVDATSGLLYWEQCNLALVEKYGVGSTVKRLKTVQKTICSYLENEALVSQIKEKMTLLSRNSFEHSVKKVVPAMFEAAAAHKPARVSA